jgi:hypothetical protein
MPTANECELQVEYYPQLGGNTRNSIPNSLTHEPVNRQDMSTIVLYRRKMGGVFLVSKVTAFSAV